MCRVYTLNSYYVYDWQFLMVIEVLQHCSAFGSVSSRGYFAVVKSGQTIVYV